MQCLAAHEDIIYTLEVCTMTSLSTFVTFKKHFEAMLTLHWCRQGFWDTTCELLKAFTVCQQQNCKMKHEWSKCIQLWSSRSNIAKLILSTCLPTQTWQRQSSHTQKQKDGSQKKKWVFHFPWLTLRQVASGLRSCTSDLNAPFLVNC